MRKAIPVTTRRPAAPSALRPTVALVAGLAACCTVSATDSAPENERLGALLRQLTQLERTALEAQQLAQPGSHRYHFDYTRLASDLARVQAGIEDYLSPPRAQPRDPDELSGQYRAPESTP